MEWVRYVRCAKEHVSDFFFARDVLNRPYEWWKPGGEDKGAPLPLPHVTIGKKYLRRKRVHPVTRLPFFLQFFFGAFLPCSMRRASPSPLPPPTVALGSEAETSEGGPGRAGPDRPSGVCYDTG